MKKTILLTILAIMPFLAVHSSLPLSSIMAFTIVALIAFMPNQIKKNISFKIVKFVSVVVFLYVFLGINFYNLQVSQESGMLLIQLTILSFGFVGMFELCKEVKKEWITSKD